MVFFKNQLDNVKYSILFYCKNLKVVTFNNHLKPSTYFSHIVNYYKHKCETYTNILMIR